MKAIEVSKNKSTEFDKFTHIVTAFSKTVWINGNKGIEDMIIKILESTNGTIEVRYY